MPAKIEDPSLVNIGSVAKLLDVSQRHVKRLDDLARMPRSIKLGRSVRWNRKAVIAWIEAGCPDLSKRRRPKK